MWDRIKAKAESCGVATDLVLPKLAYLTILGSFGAIMPFLPVFYKQQEIPISQIGVLVAIRPFIIFFASPVWAIIADKLNKHKLLLIICIVVSTALRFMILFVRDVAGLAVLLICLECVGSPINPLLDASIIQILGPERKDQYGRQRLYGAFGYGAAAFIIGILIDKVEDFSVLFYLHTGLIALGLLCVFNLPIKGAPVQGNFFANIKLAFGNLPTFAFFVAILLMGMGSGVVSNYGLLQAKSLGGQGLVLGLMIFVSCSSETAFFFFSKPLLEYLSPQGMLLASLACYTIRFVWYALAPTAWAILPAESLHGLTFAMMWAASINYAHTIAPEGMGATVQSLITGCFSGLGSGTGSLLGGLVIGSFNDRSFGGSVLFVSLASLEFVALLMFFTSVIFCHQKR